MGTCAKLPSVNMKFLIALSALLAVACATFEPTREDCEAVVNAISAQLTSQESIDKQVEVLLAEVCPMDEHPEDCVEGLPAFWNKIAMVLWPGYWDASAEWMCGGMGTRAMTCDECTEGIMAGGDQLLSAEFVAGIVDALSGDGFCGMEEDPEECAAIMPALAGVMDPAQLTAVRIQLCLILAQHTSVCLSQ